MLGLVRLRLGLARTRLELARTEYLGLARTEARAG